MSGPQRTRIFISYGHADRDWLEKFQTQLKGWLRGVSLEAWDDRQIEAGDKWRDEIRQAIDASCIAVLLVGPEFLASEFIMGEELPMLRQATKEHGLKILWVALKPASYESEFGDVQALNDPAKPLFLLDDREQSRDLAEICRKIRDRVPWHIVPPEPVEGGPKSLAAPLRTFTVRPLLSMPCMVDDQGQLWVTEGQRVKLFQVGRDQFLAGLPLPGRRWKCHAPHIWRGSLLMSDWEGSLFRFHAKGRAGDEPLYRARPDDLPIHRMAVGADGTLVAASWNGVIRMWDADGHPAMSGRVTVPALPLHLVPLRDRALVVADQQNCLRLLAPGGEQRWCFQADDEIRAVWDQEESGQVTLIAQLGAQRLVKVVDAKQTEQYVFDQPVVDLSRRNSENGDVWTVVAGDQGRVTWLSASPFAEMQRLDVDPAPRQIIAVEDRQNRALLTAVGLTPDGRLLAARENESEFWDHPSGIQRLLVDPTGRFLFLLFDDRIEVHRNPATSMAACQVQLVDPLEGELKVGVFNRVVVRLRNTGTIPICRIEADLSRPGIVERAGSETTPPEPVRCGETVDLELSVCAKVEGYLELDLRLRLSDEAGPMDSDVELRFAIKSVH